ncbi:MAG: Asp-tRNA(Asn)/Glu-tRNA(Gln) amidotransferase subunit GatB, partial [Chlamydiae bacterium]|nr:Asp-tRNA(Asn)/Glu-tRNA(Gln) amidotransferase subunit GatB [Chlamydiota bacterium]
MNDWEAVIGLEIHVQLNTKSKLFSSAPNQFGHEPNVNISFADTGQPGALPVINKAAIEKAVLFGLAINAHIPEECHFDRKSYFYPDSPRNFQITQFDEPIIVGGSVAVEIDGEEKVFGIHHAHLEDDAGMLKHFSQFAGVDYNRAGVALVEIVSLPCIHTAKEAALFATEIRSIMQYIDASDCNMEEGSLRIDANVSVRKKGETTLRTKTEIKNMNSFANMELAIDAEILRQIDLYQQGKTVTSGTYRFDLATGATILMRKKETADDYRYFPEPDLPPLFLDKNWIAKLKENLPELPRERKKRYIEKLGLSHYSASLLICDKPLGDIFEKGLSQAKNPVSFCNWLTVEFIGRIKNSRKSVEEFGLDILAIASLSNMVDDKIVTGKVAKQIADLMVENPGKTPE